jgi:MFS family permease
MTSARTAFIALAATLAIQIYTSFAATATAVLAPEIAREFAMETRWIGVFVGIVYAGAMFSSLASGSFIERHGSIRVSQVCVVFCAIGACVCALAPVDAPALLALAAVVLGAGYGPITPASSQLLQRTASPSRMALTFSIKQTGVPAGAALAGALLPALSIAIGWRTAFAAAGAFGIAIIAASQPIRARLDMDTLAPRAFSLAGIFAPLALLRQSRPLLELALLSLVYSATQVCLVSFLVVHLTESLHWTLVSAGFALTAATVGGVAGRIGWGFVADRWLRPRSALSAIGLLAGACGVGMTLATPQWPAPAIIGLAALFGATAIGWNGVQLAEVARLAPPGTAGKVTGASGFVTFAGVVIGPPSFALLASLTGSYRVGFATFAALSTGMALLLIRRRDGARKPAS